MHVFTSKNSQQIASSISRLLGVSVSRSIKTAFPNSEHKVTIISPVKEKKCVFIHSTVPPVDASFMELFFTLDALKRSGCQERIAVVPYLGYTRQDKQHHVGECISLQVIARFLKSAHCSRLITVNMHNNASIKLFTVPTVNLDATPVMASLMTIHLKKILQSRASQIVVVAPDKGAVNQAKTFIKCISKTFPTTLAIVDKVRDKKTNKSHIENIKGDFHNKVAIIVDDVITSGDTVFQTAKKAKQMGARLIFSAVIHNDLLPDSYKKLTASCIEMLFVSNSMEQTQKNKKLRICSISPLIASKLKRYN